MNSSSTCTLGEMISSVEFLVGFIFTKEFSILLVNLLYFSYTFLLFLSYTGTLFMLSALALFVLLLYARICGPVLPFKANVHRRMSQRAHEGPFYRQLSHHLQFNSLSGKERNKESIHKLPASMCWKWARAVVTRARFVRVQSHSRVCVCGCVSAWVSEFQLCPVFVCVDQLFFWQYLSEIKLRIGNLVGISIYLFM